MLECQCVRVRERTARATRAGLDMNGGRKDEEGEERRKRARRVAVKRSTMLLWEAQNSRVWLRFDPAVLAQSCSG